ncbi:DUF6541 family protein [Curtanaerobium respiraculi]|uniref:DUF6541 family protein n=1 Tax=Curtanaerobium respiraculi TaxID=2949669 RepID=UPI0024B39B25|nr:DUF6541 family protein [Curtanaerobium respiraculi]
MILIVATLACLAVLYVPGIFVARAARLDALAAAASAPLFGTGALVVLGVAFDAAGVRVSGAILAAASFALCAAAWLLARAASARRGGAEPAAVRHPSEDARYLRRTAALYVAVALLITSIVFVHGIRTPDAFSRCDDTTFHLSVIRSFVETGSYSVLNVSSYLAQGAPGTFYPAVWNVVAAVVASLFGADAVLASNAAIVAFTAFVVPLGVCLLLHVLFRGDRAIVRAGSFVSVAFCAFPWGFILYGQLLPNMVSFAFLPIVFAFVVSAVDARTLPERIRGAALAAAGLAVVVASQPNGAFTLGIWSVAFLVSRAFYAPGAMRPVVSAKRVGLAVAVAAVAIGVWVASYFSPVFSGVIAVNWRALAAPPKAVPAALLYMFTGRMGIQPILSLLVLVGVLRTFKDRRYLWLTVAYAFSLVLVIVDMCTEGLPKHFLTGFWYTDYFRTGAMCALFSIPLAAMGCAWLIDKLSAWAKGRNPSRWDARRSAVVAAAVAVLVVGGQFVPAHFKVGGSDVRFGLVKAHQQIDWRYRWDRLLTREEDEFIKQVMSEIPRDSLVVNVPSDGSCWTYGVEGLHTYFHRTYKDGGVGGEQQSALLRTKLCDIATSEEVQQAVRDCGATYVLMLDDLSGDHRTTTGLRYKEKDWAGIESITPDTPGFTLVKSEDDMRLYRIDLMEGGAR